MQGWAGLDPVHPDEAQALLCPQPHGPPLLPGVLLPFALRNEQSQAAFLHTDISGFPHLVCRRTFVAAMGTPQ